MATLECFEDPAILVNSRESSSVVEAGLDRLKILPFVAHVRGEPGGMVWGVEMCDHAGQSAAEWANAVVLSCYHGEKQDGIHLLGPLAKNVIRIAPPLIITPQEADDALKLMLRCCQRMIA
jgi:4-aminobutyrate aminotransferase-like enzyme